MLTARRMPRGRRPRPGCACAHVHRRVGVAATVAGEVLSPTLEVCEALLAGEAVPVDALDPEALARFRPGTGTAA